MESIEVLRREHRLIEKVIGVLNGIVRSMEGGEEPPVERIKKIVRFSKVFIDRCHHGKEETCLFPCLEKRGIRREGGPIGVMLEEHEMGRTLVRQIEESLNQSQIGNRKSEIRDRLLSLCSKYVRLLTQHIFKEDNVLFQMTVNHMNDDDDRQTLKGYDRVEEERVGPGIHDEMHRLSEEIIQHR